MSQYNIGCGCGRTIRVTASMAGTQQLCGCGTTVEVPTLGKLREQAGQDAYITNAAERINKLLREGGKPAGVNCVECGVPTSDVLRCRAVCETVWRRESGGRQWLATLALIALSTVHVLAMFKLLSSDDGDGEVTLRGRDVVVDIPVPICEDCRRWLGRPTSRKVRRLLSKAPLYSELLTEYPRARIEVLD